MSSNWAPARSVVAALTSRSSLKPLSLNQCNWSVDRAESQGLVQQGNQAWNSHQTKLPKNSDIQFITMPRFDGTEKSTHFTASIATKAVKQGQPQLVIISTRWQLSLCISHSCRLLAGVTFSASPSSVSRSAINVTVASQISWCWGYSKHLYENVAWPLLVKSGRLCGCIHAKCVLISAVGKSFFNTYSLAERGKKGLKALQFTRSSAYSCKVTGYQTLDRGSRQDSFVCLFLSKRVSLQHL